MKGNYALKKSLYFSAINYFSKTRDRPQRERPEF